MRKMRTSVTLSRAVLTAVDELTGPEENRSAVIERALQFYIANKDREARDRRDILILNAKADELNVEAEDVLGYQVDL